MLSPDEERLLVAIKAAEDLGVPFALVGDRYERVKTLYVQELIVLIKTENGRVAALTQRGRLALKSR